jgi:hypothetical protein
MKPRRFLTPDHEVRTMPTGNDPPRHPADGTLIDHLARRLGRVWSRLGPIEAIADGEAWADALSAQV